MLEVGKETSDVLRKHSILIHKAWWKICNFFPPLGVEWAHFSYMQLYRKLVKMKNVIIFLLGKLSREAAYFYVYHTHTTTMQKLRKVFIKPSNFQIIILSLLAGRHIFSWLSKGKVIPRFWKTHSHTLPLKEPLGHCSLFSTLEHLGSEYRKVFGTAEDNGQRVGMAHQILAVISHPCTEFLCSQSPKAISSHHEGAAQRFWWSSLARTASISSHQHITYGWFWKQCHLWHWWGGCTIRSLYQVCHQT